AWAGEAGGVEGGGVALGYRAAANTRFSSPGTSRPASGIRLTRIGRSLTGKEALAVSVWSAVSVTLASSRTKALPFASGRPTKESGSLTENLTKPFLSVLP